MPATARPIPPPAAELAGWTPPQVDELIADIWSDIYDQEDLRTRALRSIASYRKQQREGRTLWGHQLESLAIQEKAHAQAEARIAELREERRPYDDEYARRRWPRYFHVDNNNGHVHTSMNCQTCYPTTRYRWLTEISGQDEKACVALVGETACTVCMPSAPVMPGFGDGRSGWARRTAEQQAERDREKAAKLAAKEAKAIYDPQGGPLRVDGWEIKTLAAAKQSLTDAVWYAARPSDNADWLRRQIEQRDQLAAAIAHKTGEQVADVIAAAEKRSKKRR